MQRERRTHKRQTERKTDIEEGREEIEWHETCDTDNYQCLLLLGDSLSYHHQMPFSTWDRDNSESGKCARRMYGGWWYRRCMNANPNGRYQHGSGLSLIVWTTWKGLKSMRKVEMKIRPLNFIMGRCFNFAWFYDLFLHNNLQAVVAAYTCFIYDCFRFHVLRLPP